MGIALVVLGALASVALRHWLAEAFATVAILGGVVAAPVVSLVAWIGMLLPAHTALHQVAPALFVAALIWLTLALVWAHIHPRPDRHAQNGAV